MSWLTSLAGRAEALLNQVDQAAATSLQEAGLASPSPKKPSHSIDDEPSLVPSFDSSGLAYEPIVRPPSSVHSVSPVGSQPRGFASTSPRVVRETPKQHPKMSQLTPTSRLSTWESSSMWSNPLLSSTPSSSSSSSSTTTSSTGTTNGTINSASTKSSSLLHPPHAPQACQATTATNTTAAHSDSLSVSSSPTPTIKAPAISSSDNQTSNTIPSPQLISEQVDGASIDIITPSSSEQGNASLPALLEVDLNSEPTQLLSPVVETRSEIVEVDMEQDRRKEVVLMEEEKLAREVDDEGVKVLQLKVSNLELENNLLRQEVHSLSDEMSSVLQRNKKSRETEAMLRDEVSTLRQQASQTDKLLCQMRSEVDDLTATLEAKDTQNQVLRSELQGLSEQLEEMRRGAELSVKERERLLQDASRSSDVQSQALTTVKNKLQMTEDALAREKQAIITLQSELADRENHFDAERKELSEALHSQQREIQQQQLRHTQIHTALLTAKQELHQMKREHEEYKLKAASVLQAKEKLISSLQSSAGGEGVNVKEAALEEARVERQHLMEQLQSSHQLVEELKAELQEIEETHSANLEQLMEQLREKEQILVEERNNHLITQEELQRLHKELDNVKNEYVEEKALMSSQLRDQESELAILKSKISSVSLDTSRRDTEERLHDLTESLIQKQTLLEQLNAERHSLQLQLNKTEAALVSAEKLLSSRQQHTAPPHTALPLGDTVHVRPMASILPSSSSSFSSHRHMNRVKTALNAVDRFSAQIGAALQRYPYVRLFALLYMVLLHVWVMVVLFTYKPEVHSDL